MGNNINIALAGNPNSGKTTLFNALTGSRQYVGNWPGVTVEKKEGKTRYNDEEIVVVDLPGTYSLSPYSLEEVIARNYIVEESPNVVVNVVDATNIERNLYLSIQLIELGTPVVIALNMMDMVEKMGINIEVKKLSKMLGVPVVPIVASKKKGIEELLDVVVRLSKGEIEYNPCVVDYGKDLEEKISETIESLKLNPLAKKYNLRWLAIKVIEGDEKVLKTLNIDDEEESFEDDEISLLDDYESIIADKKYQFITEIVSKAVNKPKDEKLTTSDKIDKVLTNKWLGIPIFAGLMYIVFFMTFNIGNIFLDIIDAFFSETVSGWASNALEAVGAAEWLKSLIVDGIIGGVGGVLTFLPNIIILFIFISILEDSGYMARVAFIMDRAMRKIGLNGKAFIPMLMGFGCNVPAIMGTRTLDNEKERIAAILINPFMSCGARLPVYILFASVFFAGHEDTVVFSLYVLGILVAIIVGLIFKKTLFKGEGAPFVMELPPYRIPTLKGIFIHVWERVKGYLVKAGTIIFAASIILWFLLGYNFSGPADITESIGASIGKAIAPIFTPLGFGNWRAALSLVSGLLAKEVVISNMAIIYGLGETVAEAALEGDITGFASTLSNTFNQLTAYAFMVFVLLYTPCVATIGVIKRETNSWKWTLFSIAYQFVVAWVMSMLVFQVGSLLGLGL
ncbi:ferrous iron transport protein B [Caloranaerobacter azorensis DSM 13643]|uniref:Ferrous iron transport protein B n=1 Tax=Caloranaerobacter azorensis DSM 13643 TaxID=1121264 RepID=A0A1M5V9F8_9FIRM|nr:ferrous iron transport protein B [Caloranaerobacter azorensis]SHH71912.1 ferrous iron transport protein B [Caloranaerobacter azorensis DSM 13643]